MGGQSYVQFPKGSRPIIKVGEDQLISKMYQMYHSSWEIYKVKATGKIRKAMAI